MTIIEKKRKQTEIVIEDMWPHTDACKKPCGRCYMIGFYDALSQADELFTNMSIRLPTLVTPQLKSKEMKSSSGVDNRGA